MIAHWCLPITIPQESDLQPVRLQYQSKLQLQLFPDHGQLNPGHQQPIQYLRKPQGLRVHLSPEIPADRRLHKFHSSQDKHSKSLKDWHRKSRGHQFDLGLFQMKDTHDPHPTFRIQPRILKCVSRSDPPHIPESWSILPCQLRKVKHSQ